MTDFINVPVPANRVSEVYALLAKPPATAGPELAEVRESPSEGSEWSDPLIRRLYEESADAMQRMLKVLAKAGGEEVSTNEIASELGLKGAPSVAGMTGAVGRRVSSRYGIKSGMPWTKRWRYIDPDDWSKGTETLLALPTWVCDIINEL